VKWGVIVSGFAVVGHVPQIPLSAITALCKEWFRARGNVLICAERFLTRLVIAGLVAFLGAIQTVAAQEPSVAGLWQKIDEQTGKPVIWFLFFDRGGVYEGDAARLFPRPGEPPSPPTCTRCRDDRKDASFLGLPIIRGMRRAGLRYKGGNILDPLDGNVYSAVMTMSPDGQSLIVRGYPGRNETWYRLPDIALRQLDPIVIATATGRAAPTVREANNDLKRLRDADPVPIPAPIPMGPHVGQPGDGSRAAAQAPAPASAEHEAEASPPPVPVSAVLSPLNVALRALVSGNIAFNTPDHIPLGKSQIVKAKLSKNLPSNVLLKQLNEAGAKESAS
jgi:hypothetical protein